VVSFFSPFFRRRLGGCFDLGAPFVDILLDADLPEYRADVNKSETAEFLTGPGIFLAKGGKIKKIQWVIRLYWAFDSTNRTPTKKRRKRLFLRRVNWITAAGVKAFIINYRHHGLEKRKTIGRWPDWTVISAVVEARKLRQQIDKGDDPLGTEQAIRGAPTVADMCDRFVKEYLPLKRPSSRRDAVAVWENTHPGDHP